MGVSIFNSNREDSHSPVNLAREEAYALRNKFQKLAEREVLAMHATEVSDMVRAMVAEAIMQLDSNR